MNEKFNKEIKLLKKNQTNLGNKGTINQIKSLVESLCNRVDHAEDRISELDDKVASIEHSYSMFI